VVPDGALQLVAFEALVTQPRGRARTTHYWLDDGPALSYGPSATSLRSLALRPRRTPAPPASREPVLSVSDVAYAPGAAPERPAAGTDGGPVLRGRAWTPLPGTARETDAIRAAFGPGRVEVMTGAAAREPAVRAALSGRHYLHIATHGFAELSSDRLNAGLVLSPPPTPAVDSDDDGFLELFEIHRLPLDCDLAVLSACETAKGTRLAGEGEFALSRGFLAAGARRVVASLWAVDDLPTATVVGSLFQAIAASEAHGKSSDVVTALRDAKRRVRRDPRWADPFYWAPFVLSGR
jgi:CHAT domain-containing protein